MNRTGSCDELHDSVLQTVVLEADRTLVITFTEILGGSSNASCALK